MVATDDDLVFVGERAQKTIEIGHFVERAMVSHIPSKKENISGRNLETVMEIMCIANEYEL